MKIYPIFSTLVDVFMGEGWENWSRVSIKRDRPQVIGGAPLSAEVLNAVKEAMNGARVQPS